MFRCKRFFYLIIWYWEILNEHATWLSRHLILLFLLVKNYKFTNFFLIKLSFVMVSFRYFIEYLECFDNEVTRPDLVWAFFVASKGEQWVWEDAWKHGLKGLKLEESEVALTKVQVVCSFRNLLCYYPLY